MSIRRASRQRVEFGDWQTPIVLANQVVSLLDSMDLDPASVVEPTCGAGSFLRSACDRWPDAETLGFEINPDYVEQARSALDGCASVKIADFFTTNWEQVFRGLPEPILVLGNPPWVTSSELGSIESKNLPRKNNFKGYSGLDAITGKANFDVSEWIILRLLNALQRSDFTLSMLCKAIVSRRVVESANRARWDVACEMRNIDATAHFGASVEAVLFTVRSSRERPEGAMVLCPRFDSLDAGEPKSTYGFSRGVSISDYGAFRSTERLCGSSVPEWRSGLKHDCSSVMEFVQHDNGIESKAEGKVDLEGEYVYPFMKGSDVANGRLPPSRAVLVTQRFIGEDTSRIKEVAPKTWDYLQRNRHALEKRRSSIYKNQPLFSVFGVGDYTFAPWKVVIAGLYKRLSFLLVGPCDDRPVVFDDTTYFLSFDTEQAAHVAHKALQSKLAQDYFNSRIFWDDKRPINKKVLQSLDLFLLQKELGLTDLPGPPRQAILL